MRNFHFSGIFELPSQSTMVTPRSSSFHFWPRQTIIQQFLVFFYPCNILIIMFGYKFAFCFSHWVCATNHRYVMFLMLWIASCKSTPWQKVSSSCDRPITMFIHPASKNRCILQDFYPKDTPQNFYPKDRTRCTRILA